jgi:hypothetical protein
VVRAREDSNTEDGRGPLWATEVLLDYVSTEAVGQTRGVEVEDEAYADAAHPQVGLQLGFVCRDDGGDRLDLENDLLVCDDVCSKAFADRDALVGDGDGDDLSVERQAGLVEFVAEALLVDRLQQASADVSMDLDGESDDAFSQGFFQQHVGMSGPAVALACPPC